MEALGYTGSWFGEPRSNDAPKFLRLPLCSVSSLHGPICHVKALLR